MRVPDCFKLKVAGKWIINIDFWKDDIVYEKYDEELDRRVFIREQTHRFASRRRVVKHVPNKEGEDGSD